LLVSGLHHYTDFEKSLTTATGKRSIMSDFKHLFEPIRIGRLNVKNRLLMSAMSINFGVDESGRVTDQLIAIYGGARPRGGGHDAGGRRRYSSQRCGAAESAGLVG
jgi:hypothetical protein